MARAHERVDAGRRRALAAIGVMGVAGAAFGGGGVVARAGGLRRAEPGGMGMKISLAQWSLHRTIRAGKLDALDFPRHAREVYGLDAVEYVNQFFMDKAGDAGYIAELKKRAGDAGVKSLLIMCDGVGALGDADEGKRTRAVEGHMPWVLAAKELGCHSIRVNAETGGVGDREEQSRRAADGLRRLTEFAAGHEMNVIVENHGGLSSDGGWLAATIRRADHPRCGTLPDFGNFRVDGNTTYDRYKGVEELMPFAKAVSAKSYDFNEAGDETTIDFARMLRIVADAGYRGYVGIEYEGSRMSEHDGIAATKRLLEREIGRLGEG